MDRIPPGPVSSTMLPPDVSVSPVYLTQYLFEPVNVYYYLRIIYLQVFLRTIFLYDLPFKIIQYQRYYETHFLSKLHLKVMEPRTIYVNLIAESVDEKFLLATHQHIS